MLRWLFAATSIGLLAALSSAPCQANTIPLSGTFSGIATLSGQTFDQQTGAFSAFENTSGSGSDVTFGAFSGFESANVSGFANQSGPTFINLSNGMFHWSFSGGYFAGTFSGSGSPGAISVSFLITDGLLPGYSGSGVGSESYTPIDQNTASIVVNYTGQINGPGNQPFAAVAETPLPSTWVMMLGALVAVAAFVWPRVKSSGLAATA